MHAKEHSKKIVSPRRRHLWGAALGNFTTLGGFIVWLIAFFTLWIVIFLFEEPSVGGECYWYLDIDRNYGGTLTVKGFEKEE